MTINTQKGEQVTSHSVISFERKRKKKKVSIHRRTIGKNPNTVIFHKTKKIKLERRRTIITNNDFQLAYNKQNELTGIRLRIRDEGRVIPMPFVRVSGAVNTVTNCTML